MYIRNVNYSVPSKADNSVTKLKCPPAVSRSETDHVINSNSVGALKICQINVDYSPTYKKNRFAIDEFKCLIPIRIDLFRKRTQK